MIDGIAFAAGDVGGASEGGGILPGLILLGAIAIVGRAIGRRRTSFSADRARFSMRSVRGDNFSTVLATLSVAELLSGMDVTVLGRTGAAVAFVCAATVVAGLVLAGTFTRACVGILGLAAFLITLASDGPARLATFTVVAIVMLAFLSLLRGATR